MTSKQDHPLPATAARHTWLCAVLMAGCTTAAPPKATPVPIAPAAAPAAPSEPPITSASELCSMLFEAPIRHLTRTCAGVPTNNSGFAELADRARRRVALCNEAIGPSFGNRRVEASRQRARACASAIENTSWRVSLRDADLTRFPECHNLVAGLQGKGKSCRLHAECEQGLICNKPFKARDGVCAQRSETKCQLPATWLFGEHRTACGEAQVCAGAPRSISPGFVGIDAIDDGRFIAKQFAFGAMGDGSDPWNISTNFGTGGLGSTKSTASATAPASLGSIGPAGNGHREPPPPPAKPVRIKGQPATLKSNLPPSVVGRVIRSRRDAYRECYTKALAGNPSLEGRITVKFSITPSGSVADISTKSDLPASVVDCVKREFRALQFPKPSGKVVVSYPIVFSSGESKPAPAPSTSTASMAKSVPPWENAIGEPSTCQALVATEGTCTHHSECASSICRAGSCVENLGVEGDACDGDGECTPKHFCAVKEGQRSVCVALRAAGSACERNGQCDGACVDDRCTALCGG